MAKQLKSSTDNQSATQAEKPNSKDSNKKQKTATDNQWTSTLKNLPPKD